MPQVVRFAEVLQDGRLDGHGRLAVGEGLDEGVERARMAVLLEDVSAGADERDQFGGQGFALPLVQNCPDLRKYNRM